MTNILKSILFTSVVLMALLCMIGTAAAEPIEIDEWSDFADVRNNLDGEFTLIAPLDFDDYLAENPGGYWEPLGIEGDPFTGTFDGGEFTISNLVLTEESYDGAAGFFGYAESAVLKNITLENATLTIGKESEPYAADIDDIGLLAGNFSGTIENCHVDGKITIFNDGQRTYSIGGLVGAVDFDYETETTEITDSSTDVGIEITGNMVYQTAGLIGYTLEACNLENCNTTGNIKIVSTSYAGDIAGLVGYTSGTSDLENCNATGDITINAPEVSGVGGLVGGGGYNGHMNNS